MTPPQLGIDFEQYKTQAKDLLKLARSGSDIAIARLLSSHPEGERLVSSPRLQLSDTQLVIARENGYASWAKFKESLLFETAVSTLDSGDAIRLESLLEQYPSLVRYRAATAPSNDFSYFANATLLHHVAGNPIRCPLPRNIVEITAVLLKHGADPNAKCGPPDGLSSTIGLILTGRQVSEARVAVTLIEMLITAGASDKVDLDRPELLDDPIWNGGIETARELVQRGARMDLPQAAALGRLDAIQRMMNERPSDPDLLEVALIYACVQNQEEIARYLVEHGAKGDVIPPAKFRGGGQATALHNAAGRGFTGIVRLLLDNGARANLRDNQWNGTPAGWATHGGHSELATLLRSHERD